MDSFEFNKIAGAVLGAALFILVVSTLSDALFASHPPEEPVYLAGLAAGDADASGAGDEDTKIETVAMLLASADVAKGEKVAKKCAACHSFDNGGANKQGPNLWDIVDRKIGVVDGFKYSADLVSLGEAEKVWDYASLDVFLRKPKEFAKGTKMAFGGISKVGDRADLIAYLRSLSDSPAPLPEVAEQADAAPDASEETQTAAAEPTGQATDATATEAAPSASAAEEKPAQIEDTATDMAAAPAESADTMEKPAESGEAQTGMAAAPSTDTADKPADSGTMTETAAPAAATEAEATSSQAEDAKPTEMAATAPAEDSTASPASEPAGGVLAMIGTQDIAAGEKVARKCKACHSFEEGGKNKSGPPLWNIVNKPIAVAEGFRYSKAMTEYGEGKTWTYEELDAYLVAPKKHIPKTKMAFAGLKKEKDRAAILAYLRSLSSDPAPLP